MVAAGVYMLARVFFLIEPDAASAQTIIAWIGGITALLAALMATQQDDIKRILAYSTLSQLGYMVMAVGLAGAGCGDVPPLHPRVLQGAALPRRRRGDPRAAITSRTSGRWAAWPVDAADLSHFRRRLSRARSASRLRGLLLEGRHSRAASEKDPAIYSARSLHRVPHGILYDASVVVVFLGKPRSTKRAPDEKRPGS